MVIIDHTDVIVLSRHTHRPASNKFAMLSKRNKQALLDRFGKRPSKAPPIPRLPAEVLTAIFSYLPQACLSITVSLVCKDWFRVSRTLIRRVGVWKGMGEDAQNDLVNRMRVLNTLEIRLLQDPELQPEYWASIDPTSSLRMWNRFVKAITKPTTRALTSLARVGTEQHRLLYNIKELSIFGEYISFKRIIQPLLPYLQVLQILRLDYQLSDATLDLFPILDHCWNLKELVARTLSSALTTKMTV
ncbi:hypothetical protein BG004_002526 [Podila humilis]|nr:hypothetical protein BG004_002526 [Podila humilis]